MDHRNSYPEYSNDDDGEDVEILEVVGVDDEVPASVLPEPRGEEAPPAAEVDPEEYVLDFDHGAGMESAGGRPLGESEPEEQRQRWVRLRADYDNLRKRIDREREEFERHANLALVSRLLPVLDNLERALAAGALAVTDGPLREGLALIHRQLIEQLRREGLQPIEAVGQHFDPNLHDAVATDSESAEPAHMVVEELQRGYLFHDRVLRPTLVKVSTGPIEPAEDS
jgi:molecular chaperone GrpE